MYLLPAAPLKSRFAVKLSRGLTMGDSLRDPQKALCCFFLFLEVFLQAEGWFWCLLQAIFQLHSPSSKTQSYAPPTISTPQGPPCTTHSHCFHGPVRSCNLKCYRSFNSICTWHHWVFNNSHAGNYAWLGEVWACCRVWSLSSGLSGPCCKALHLLVGFRGQQDASLEWNFSQCGRDESSW